VKGQLDATRVGWRCGVEGNKVEKEGFRFPRKRYEVPSFLLAKPDVPAQVGLNMG